MKKVKKNISISSQLADKLAEEENASRLIENLLAVYYAQNERLTIQDLESARKYMNSVVFEELLQYKAKK